MHEIVCPHCGKAFKIDEAGYADIAKQIRDGAPTTEACPTLGGTCSQLR